MPYGPVGTAPSGRLPVVGDAEAPQLRRAAGRRRAYLWRQGMCGSHCNECVGDPADAGCRPGGATRPGIRRPPDRLKPEQP